MYVAYNLALFSFLQLGCTCAMCASSWHLVSCAIWHSSHVSINQAADDEGAVQITKVLPLCACVHHVRRRSLGTAHVYKSSVAFVQPVCFLCIVKNVCTVRYR